MAGSVMSTLHLSVSWIHHQAGTQMEPCIKINWGYNYWKETPSLRACLFWLILAIFCSKKERHMHAGCHFVDVGWNLATNQWPPDWNFNSSDFTKKKKKSVCQVSICQDPVLNLMCLPSWNQNEHGSWLGEGMKQNSTWLNGWIYSH